jgi:hypothetical protein
MRRGKTRTLGAMKDGTDALVIIVFAAAVVFADRLIRRRALRKNSVWKCYRCGVSINPFDGSRDVQVAGRLNATFARFCKRCAKRETKLWLSVGVMIALLVAGILYLTHDA